jgi:DNA-binding transcriptional ArsR family regulator
MRSMDRAGRLIAARPSSIVRHMAKFYDDALSRTFGALQDPTRRTILSLLQQHPGCSVGQLVEQLPYKLPGVTKHLDVLARAGLIDRTKVGRVVSVQLTAAPLRTAKDWLTQYEAFWSGSLDKLQRRLERGR